MRCFKLAIYYGASLLALNYVEVRRKRNFRRRELLTRRYRDLSSFPPDAITLSALLSVA